MQRAWLSVLAFVFLSGICPSEIKASKPNILMIIVDDLRPQLGCYGHKETYSPNIDRIAAEGTLFENAYVQVPVCGASRASLMTGLYPTADRFVTYYSSVNIDAPEIIDIPGHLKSHGYSTTSNGKIYHQKEDCTNSWDEISRPADFRVYLDPDKAEARAAYEYEDVEDDAYPSGKMANKIIQDLQSAKKTGQPFFITAGFTKPHLPFIAPKKYWDLYRPVSINLAKNPYAPKGVPKQATVSYTHLTLPTTEAV